MYRGLLQRWWSVSLVAMSATASLAEDSTAGLAFETLAERRIDSNGVVYAPATGLQVGDEIFYTLRAKNTSTRTLDDAVVIRPVPRNTRYVADSAVGPAATISYSVDGGKTFGPKSRLTIATPDGVRAAIADDYTHIRWQLRHSLAPGAIAILRFRALFQ